MRSQSRDRTCRAFGALLAALALFGAPGCGEEKGTPTTEPQREELSAGQISHVAMLLNHAEIGQAQISIDRLKDKEVAELAHKITVEHTALQNKIEALTEKMRTKPEESELGRDVRRVGDSMTQQLRNAPTPDFDLSYIEVQIFMHRRALTVIDRQLLPQSDDTPELRAILQEMRTHVSEHLMEAMRLRKKFPPVESGL